jgi:hypothetical protein
MRISVAGACSRAGKTAAAVSILQARPARSTLAIKFTTTDDVFERCPRGTPCVVCDIDVPYRIIDDPATLRQPGTDTDRLSGAGASRVIWVIAKQAAAERAWRAVALRTEGAPCVVEGSTVVEHTRPDLLIFVVHPRLPPSRWKPTSGPLLARADLVVVNAPGGEAGPKDEVLAEIARYRPAGDVRVADVTRPFGAWAPEWAPRLGGAGALDR